MIDVWDKLDMLLASNDEELVVYVYRLDANRKVVKPYLLKGEASHDLLTMLRDDYGGGDFKLLIRRGRGMVFGGDIAIVAGHSKKALLK